MRKYKYDVKSVFVSYIVQVNGYTERWIFSKTILGNFTGFKVYIETVEKRNQKTIEQMSDSNTRHVCYEHNRTSFLKTEMFVHCTQLHEGNTVRIVLSPGKDRQLVLCEVNVNGGKLAYHLAFIEGFQRRLMETS